MENQLALKFGRSPQALTCPHPFHHVLDFSINLTYPDAKAEFWVVSLLPLKASQGRRYCSQKVQKMIWNTEHYTAWIRKAWYNCVSILYGRRVLPYFEMKAFKSKDWRGKNWYQTLSKLHLEISPLWTLRMKRDQVEELHYLGKPTMTKLLQMSEVGLKMPAGSHVPYWVSDGKLKRRKMLQIKSLPTPQKGWILLTSPHQKSYYRKDEQHLGKISRTS